MLDQRVRANMRVILACQLFIGFLCIMICAWRGFNIWGMLHMPPPHSIGERYYVIRVEQLNIYICMGVMVILILVDRIINYWWVSRRIRVNRIRFGRRRLNIVPAIDQEKETKDG